MEKGAKIIRLCAALIKKGWAGELLAELKAELGVGHKVYKLLRTIVQKHDGDGVLLDKGWTLEQWEKENGNLGKMQWELRNLIEDFLLRQHQNEEYNLLRELSLYEIYRQLGLHKENVERFQRIEALANNSNEKHLHLHVAIFKQEVAKVNLLNANHYVELSHALYVYWISECLFDACMKLHAIYPHDELQIPSLSVEVMREIIEGSPILQKDSAVQVHLRLYDYLRLEVFSEDMTLAFEQDVIPLISELPVTRQQDIYVLITNKYIGLYKKHRTVFYARLNWKAIEKDVQNVWIHRGNKIEFNIYRNLMAIYVSANEYIESEEVIGNQLRRYEELYKGDVIFPSNDNKKLQLFEAFLNWKLRRNLLELAEMNTASFTDEGMKEEVLRYQVKARYLLFLEGVSAYSSFWEWLGEKFKNKTFVIEGHYKIEVTLWKCFLKISKSPKVRMDCITELRELRDFLVNTDVFYHDRNWYLGLIEKFLSNYSEPK